MKLKLLITLLANLVNAGCELKLVGLGGPLREESIATEFATVEEALQDKIALRKTVESALELDPLKALGLQILLDTQNLEDELTLSEELAKSSSLTLTCVVNSLSCVCGRNILGYTFMMNNIFGFVINEFPDILFAVKGNHRSNLTDIDQITDLEDLIGRNLEFTDSTFFVDGPSGDKFIGAYLTFWRKGESGPDEVWLTETSILAEIQVYRHYLKNYRTMDVANCSFTRKALMDDQYEIFKAAGVEIRCYEDIKEEKWR